MRKADNLPPSWAIVTKSGNLNFLEPSGHVQACNGTALPLHHFTKLKSRGGAAFCFQVYREKSDFTEKQM